MNLWRGRNPLILASKSEIRRSLLLGAGIPIEVVPADIDERGIESRTSCKDPQALALELARAKADAVARQYPDRLVLGADQTLGLDERIFSKPFDTNSARGQLQLLRGRTHSLYSAVAVVLSKSILFHHCERADLSMRNFSDEFLEAYLAAAGRVVTSTVGGYQLEGLGVQLFESVAGDHFTVLGLPLFALLGFMRREALLVN